MISLYVQLAALKYTLTHCQTLCAQSLDFIHTAVENHFMKIFASWFRLSFHVFCKFCNVPKMLHPEMLIAPLYFEKISHKFSVSLGSDVFHLSVTGTCRLRQSVIQWQWFVQHALHFVNDIRREIQSKFHAINRNSCAQLCMFETQTSSVFALVCARMQSECSHLQQMTSNYWSERKISLKQMTSDNQKCIQSP